jgi:uncharacterized protein YukE
MADQEIRDITPDLTPLLESGVTEPPVPHLWDEFQGVQNAAVRAALAGTPLETLQKQYKDRFDKAAAFIEERSKMHSTAVEAEDKRLRELADSLHKRREELEAVITPLRESWPAARKAFIEAGDAVNSLRRKVRAAHLQFQFKREDEITQHRMKRNSTPNPDRNGSWLARIWPFRRPQKPAPIQPYETKQPDIEDADVPPELVDQVNTAWKSYSTAQADWTEQDEKHSRVSAELARVEAQIIDTRNRCGWLDRYEVQILDFHKAAKLKLEIEYEQIQAALLDAYALTKASMAEKNAGNLGNSGSSR